MVSKLTESLMNRTEPSMKRKLPPSGWFVWKAAGLAFGEFTVY